MTLLTGPGALAALEPVGIWVTEISGMAPLTVAFRATVPEEGPASRFEWTFGDGGVSQEPGPSHTFDEPGLYTVGLTVRLASGVVRTAVVQVMVHSGG